jgi:hypothetical protein
LVSPPVRRHPLATAIRRGRFVDGVEVSVNSNFLPPRLERAVARKVGRREGARLCRLGSRVLMKAKELSGILIGSASIRNSRGPRPRAPEDARRRLRCLAQNNIVCRNAKTCLPQKQHNCKRNWQRELKFWPGNGLRSRKDLGCSAKCAEHPSYRSQTDCKDVA